MEKWLNNILFKLHTSWVFGHNERLEIRVEKCGKKHKKLHYHGCTKCDRRYYLD